MADIAARLDVSRQLVSIAMRGLPGARRGSGCRRSPRSWATGRTWRRAPSGSPSHGTSIQAAVRRIDQPALLPSVSVVEPWLVVRGSTSRPSSG